MDGYETNPFQELYVTDSPDPRTFVALFSSFSVRHALALFRAGHVVLRGTQGSGKSMLLNLLRPQIRLAYNSAGAEFPVPTDVRRFVGAGINLTRSGALDIGNRPLDAGSQRDESLFPLYFADFLNYYVVRDILSSVAVMSEVPEAFDDIVKAEKLDEFARAISREDCWFGALADCDSFSDLCELIDTRIGLYRSFHLYNIDEMPAFVRNSKTNIGEPIARAAELLRNEKVIPEETPVFVRIDQLERLYRSDTLRPTVGKSYRQIVNKALGQRDSRVWYRVGTRQHAWDDDLEIFGTYDRLEHLRDFRVIDLDEMLRRKEDLKTWIFPEFAEDAFARRLRHAAYEGSNAKNLVKRVFGSSEDPAAAAKNYTQNSSASRVLKLDDFPEDWRIFLSELFISDPLSAVLAGAWARQRGTSGRPDDRLAKPPPKDAPWKRSYWRKERVRQALLQIAARSAQRLKWSGTEHIFALSAGNISIFLSICHEIWDAFLRAERRRPREKRHDPIRDGLNPDIQAVGVQTASSYWYDKIPEQPDGDDRRRFLNVLAAQFKTWLLSDYAMSYPGHNGFSVAVDELLHHDDVASFLGEASDYGDLYEVPHTTKERNRKQRRKWYISPILSPFYQLPESHVKEPYYSKVSEVSQWIVQAGIYFTPNADIERLHRAKPKRFEKASETPGLFDHLPEITKK